MHLIGAARDALRVRARRCDAATYTRSPAANGRHAGADALDFAGGVRARRVRQLRTDARTCPDRM